jgi:hypothetical protein
MLSYLWKKYSIKIAGSRAQADKNSLETDNVKPISYINMSVLE